MDDLFAAIAAYLRERNARLTAERAPVERVWTGSLRTYGGMRVYCKVCGRPITSGEGLFEVEALKEDRSCAEHFIPF